MPTSRLAALLALLAAAPAAAQPARADSLLERFVEAVGYDAFVTGTFSAEIDLPEGLPRAPAVREAWRAVFTADWLRARIRREFLGAADADEVQAMLDWAEDPVVRRAIAQDYGSAVAAARAGGAGPSPAGPDPQLLAAARRVSRAAGDGLPWVRYEADRTVAFLAFALGDRLTPERRAEMEQAADRSVRAFRAEGVEFMRQMVAVRFAGFPADDLAHYAAALETPPGRTYLRLVVDSPLRAMRAAVALALAKAER